MRVDRVVFGGRYHKWSRPVYIVTHVDDVDDVDKREADDLDFMYSTRCSQACDEWLT
jgi:hypothetical protein